MKVIRKYAEKEGCWTDDKSKWDVDYTSTMWNKIGEKYINAKFSGKKRRNAELSWKTVYNKMVKAKETFSNLLTCKKVQSLNIMLGVRYLACGNTKKKY